MQISRISLVVAVVLVSVVPSGALMRSRRGPTAQRTQKKSSSKPVVRHTSFKPGQRGIDDSRATEIQQALIKAGYLSGEPTGHWDASTESAMQKLQGDNGWQTKLVPDSRALIKLGLGPKVETSELYVENSIEATGTK